MGKMRVFKIIFVLVVVITLMIGLSACSSADEDTEIELTVSAAASMADAVEEIKFAFEKEYPTTTIHINTSSSGRLMQQISQGAPVDLFLSASKDKFNHLITQGLIDENNYTDLVGNELVLIAPSSADDQVRSFEDLTHSEVNKVSIGTPESVPAGMYAKEALQARNVFDEIQDKLVYGKDVRQVVTYVETNSVQAGIVYQSDAIRSNKVDIVTRVEEEDHTPIIYPVGVIKDSASYQQAVLLYNYLTSEWAQGVFEEHGFTPIEVDNDEYE